jgi:hypothetical protein
MFDARKPFRSLNWLSPNDSLWGIENRIAPLQNGTVPPRNATVPLRDDSVSTERTYPLRRVLSFLIVKLSFEYSFLQ